MAARYDLDSRGGVSKYQYLHRCVRSDIRNGILEAGSRLPAKRFLASELSVSVSTVEHAYSLLVSEGYLEAKPGSGFVACLGKAEGTAFFDLEDASIPDPSSLT
ncbi:MAG: winged helix-turn-helix transcriptional regulator [Eggerthella sp.]|nr:winged helix-turn-helix transcriptional regulator [Eggerthella sp.]